ncbi:MAG: sigma 54-interacting transcriptional regulator [Lachnospiraceae bacterium]|jgi:transcriptional regulator with PAS, ATPase and Fis domain|nr:sigma 54-interacting transcriptional regulator [Lachnospiraceae bacterium]MCI8996720.1 sigma 54-interacting transcriptional regulator [Lachnospiraceae bacterium]MCI9134497.1 sigma 54-interacting transcriptional regulator [Lachnospiraceae bacterium]
MDKNLMILTSHKDFYGSLKGASSAINKYIADIWYRPHAYEEPLTELESYIRHNDIHGIIARSPWAIRIEQNLDIPIFPFKLDAHDMLINISMMQNRGYKSFGLISNTGSLKSDFTYGSITIIRLDKILLYMAHTKSREETEYIIERMTSLYEIEAIVGDIECMESSKKHGLPFFPYALSGSFLAETIENAARTVRWIDNQKRHAKYVETLTNIISECSIITDKEGTILFSNSNARDTFQLSSKHTSILSLLPLSLEELMVEQTNRLVEISGKFYIMNVLPVVMDSELNYSFLFSNTQYIESAEMSVRRQRSDNNLIAKHCFNDIIYGDALTEKTIEIARQYALSDGTVLITGESGVGKEIFASSVHNGSPRKKEPFVAINCATLTESLIESELFGYEKGAFTGALSSGKKGLFELAHKGTIFLDEIGELPLSLQAKLLRVLQEHEVRHLGGSKNILVDVRIIAATNKNLREMVQNGTFREDLYFRLSLLELQLYPLRARPHDIVPIFKFMINRLSKRTGRKMYWKSDDIFQPLLQYSWPGNIRELENIAERTVLLSNSLQLTSDFLKNIMSTLTALPEFGSRASVQSAKPEPQLFSVADTVGLDELESLYVKHLLETCENDKEKVCRLLKISKPTLYRKLAYKKTSS